MRLAWVAAMVLLAGCVQPGADPPGTSSPAATTSGTHSPLPVDVCFDSLGQGARETSHSEHPVKMSSKVRSEARSHELCGLAANEGSTTYQVRGGCQRPLGSTLRDAEGQTFDREEPQLQCMGFGHEEWRPGMKIGGGFFWNETRWNPDAQKVEKAPPGDYSWEVTFTFYLEPDGVAQTLRSAFQVKVA